MDWLPHIIYPLARWLHIVSVTLIVGGTLFFELVVPIAIEDLKKEQQLYVFARARWVFRWVVWVSTVLLLATGLVSFFRLHHSYFSTYPPSLPFILTHISLAMVSLAIALSLTSGRRPPDHPLRWMQINLVILLVVIFSASTTRHVRMTLREDRDTLNDSITQREEQLKAFELKLNERQRALDKREGELGKPATTQAATPPESP